MTEPRRSTVYDYADLRLHPDGSRVYQKDSNRQLWLANKVVQTGNKTWIATDAGGSVNVPRYRPKGKKKAKKVEEEEEEEEEEIDLNGVGDSEEEEKVQEDNGKAKVGRTSGDEEDQSGQKRKWNKKVDGRTIKRRKFLQDFSYIGSGDEGIAAASSSGAIPMEQNASPLPHHDPFPFEPSADLLKFIHRFAAEYYTERGELLNISREFRKQRKARRLAKLAKAKQKREAKQEASKQAKSKGKGKAADITPDEVQDEEDASSDAEQNDDEEESPSSSEDEDEEDNDKDGDAQMDSESDYLSDNGSSKGEGTSSKGKKGQTSVKKRLRWKGRKRAEMLYKDMYKTFDGSALLAIGMLVQEQIASLLMAKPPEGWEEEVKRTYGREEPDDASNDDDHGYGTDNSLNQHHDERLEGDLQDPAEGDNESDTAESEHPHTHDQAAQPDDDSGNNHPSNQNKSPRLSSPQDESDPEHSSSSSSHPDGNSSSEDPDES